MTRTRVAAAVFPTGVEHEGPRPAALTSLFSTARDSPHVLRRRGRRNIHLVIGPSFQDVAGKYQGKDVEAALLDKIKNGGSGVWGQVSMPPNPQVPDPDLHAIVKWILTLK